MTDFASRHRLDRLDVTELLAAGRVRSRTALMQHGASG
jgi:hypothetical protein